MVVEAFFPTAFTAYVRSPIRECFEVSYLVAILGSLAFFISDALATLRAGFNPVRVLRLIGGLSWCLVLFLCCFLMAVRTGI
jgi:hypothetical protein